jgi:hypothetical protein
MLNRAYSAPPESPDAVSPEPPPHHPKEEKGRPREPLRRRHLLWILLTASVLLILVLVAFAFDGYLRRTLEAKINQKLHGYHVALGHAHLSPFGLGLTLRDVVIRQDANPEPPVASIPRLKMSVEWSRALTGRLVADAVFFQPRVHVNLPQLEAEAKDPTKMKERGWQQAFESIYPLKFNLIQVRDGDLVYIDKDPKWPFQVSHWNASASNIRNIQSHTRLYPSAIHTEGVVFDTGRAALDGHADFLSVPFPGVHAFYKAQNIPLDRLRPFGERANLNLRGGTLSSRGEVEYGPRHREARIADVVVNRLRLDYTHTAATAPAEKARGKAVAKAVKNQEPGMPVAVARLHLVDSDLGVIAPVKGGRFRFFVDGANLDVTNLSSGFRKGPAKATLTGRFLGTGSAHGSSTFSDDGHGPDFNLLLAVDKASLPKINDLLRSYLKFDVAAGTFSVYSEVKVRNGHIDGYIKPLFQDLKVYDPKKDQNKPVLKKLYEKVVGGVAHILENHKNEQVATVANISGPLSAPNTSTWEIVSRLISNAFVKAILPGFEREYKAANGIK